MTSPAQDRLFYENGIQELEAYLLSDELYWMLSPDKPGHNLQRLTIGGLLLVRVRLAPLLQSPAEKTGLAELDDQLELSRRKWRAAWERKVMQELHARLDLWQNYLMDYSQSPESFYDVYPQEVRWRVLIRFLSAELTYPFSELSKLASLDEILKSNFIAGDFIWDSYLKPVLPEKDFWFLYGSLSPHRSTEKGAIQ